MELTKETSLFKKDAIKTDVTAAAATATNYIDDVPNSSQTGMTLQPASNTANNYIQLDSDGLAVYKAGQLIASYGQSILLYHPGVSPLNAAVEITNSSARFTGQIQADSGYIGGWSIGADTNQSLHNGAANVSPAPGEGKIILSTGISGSNVQNGLLPPNKTWAFTAGNQFGVTTDGELYASGAHLEDLSVGNYSDATTNHLYGNCVWSPPFAAYFNTDLGNTRRTYQGWTIEQNTGEYFDFDTTNNWLVVDYSDYADKAITKVLQQNTGIIAPNTSFTISANLGTDCKVVFGGVEISGTDWLTADDGRKYATITTTANTTSGVFEIWPVASENYIFKGNKFKLEKSDSYSSWTTLDEQIGKTGNAISQSAEATASYFLNFTSADGLKISNDADPSTTTTDYIQITSNGVKTVYDSTHFSNLTSDGLRIYSGNSTYPVADFITNNNQAAVHLYKPGTNVAVATIDSNGGHFTGKITTSTGNIGGWTIGNSFLSTSTSGTPGTGVITLSTGIAGPTSKVGNLPANKTWAFTAGNKFGVTTDGDLYASGAFITDIDTSGITVTTDRITSGSSSAIISGNGLVIKQGGYTAASFSGSEINLYANNSLGANITSGGMSVYSGSTSVADFGSTVRIGASGRGHISVSSTKLEFYDSRTRLGYIKTESSVGHFVIEHNSGNAGVVLSNGAATVHGNTGLQLSSSNGKVSISGSVVELDPVVLAGTLYSSDYQESSSATPNTHYGKSSIYSGYYKVGLIKGGSSRRYKHDIKPIENDDLNPHNLYDLGVIQFVYNKDYLDNEKDDRYDRPVAGFVAEEMREIYPTAVDMENGRPETWNPRYIIPPMLALIQEQNKRITELEKRVL